MRKIKVGIDVGGTFTHAVAIDTEQFEIIGKSCVPTTHSAEQGVALGVVESMNTLIKNEGILPEEVVLIAHSTTQATNALLEGDVAPVGIIAMGTGLEGKIVKAQTFLDDIELAPGKLLPVSFKFLDNKEPITASQAKEAIEELQAQGAQVIVATEAFGPENNDNELTVLHQAEAMGIVATAAANLSQLFGLKIRTRTAVINAAMLPKMIGTANMTEQAVRNSGIKAPLMVMRSDGGIMDVTEMRKRPILTMLSGPAAGVTAALMYAKISDGIFIEVGGTSSDISVIKNGMPQIKTAQIGKHRLSVNTLDIRTLGVGGGSVPRFSGKHISDVGPRSAHIAALSYAAYGEQTDFSDAQVSPIQPVAGDPKDYLKVSSADKAYTITPTEASYYQGLVKEVGHGQANMVAVTAAVDATAKVMGTDGPSLAEEILTNCSEKIGKTVDGLIREYKLDRELITFVGGGGGASAIVPHASKHNGIAHKIAENAEVISAIGAALGMIREVVERSMVNPSDEDIKNLRNQAMESVIAMGALPESVEVTVEIDNSNKKVKAIAMGSSDTENDQGQSELSEKELTEAVAVNMKTSKEDVSLAGTTSMLNVFRVNRENPSFFGLLKSKMEYAAVVGGDGVIRRKFQDVEIIPVTVASSKASLIEVVERLRSYGDGGELVPSVYLVISGKIIDMSGLIQMSQILSMVDVELKDFVSSEKMVIIAEKKR